MSLFTDLYWRESWWLLLAILPWLAVTFALFHQRRSLHQLADTSLHPWMITRPKGKVAGFRRILIALAWLMFCVSLAGPRTPAWVPPALKGPDQQLMVVIDFSASMRVRDGHPDRVNDAIQLLHRLSRLQSDDLAVGLVLYAGQAHLILPPSVDRTLLSHYLEQLPRMSPPILGNNLTAALQLARQSFHADSSRTILVMTDGDLGAQGITDAQRAVEQIPPDTKILWIGVGSDEHGAVPSAKGESMIIDGHRVFSRRDTTWLRELAESPDMTYHAAETLDDNHLSALIGSIRHPRVPKNAYDRILWNELFTVPLLIGILFLLLALHWGRVNRHRSALTLLVSLLLSGCQWPTTTSQNAAIDKALQKESYSEVRTLAEEAEGYRALCERHCLLSVRRLHLRSRGICTGRLAGKRPSVPWRSGIQSRALAFPPRRL